MNHPIRPRRNRKSEAIRSLVRENKVTSNDLVAPLFVLDGKNIEESIPSLPGHSRLSVDRLLEEISLLVDLGIQCVSLFPVCDSSLKTPHGKEAVNPDGFYQRAIGEVKSRFPHLMVMSDVALDPYSSDGHDGIVDKKTGEILNDPSLEILGEMALIQAQAGSDIVGPSDMMDGRIRYIRDHLDREGMVQTSILSYCAKYASSFYKPFRNALDSVPKKGDKKTYQMDFANERELLREIELDEKEGADILMIKPGLPYLDILKKSRENTSLPLAVFNVSGEYAMFKAAVERGWLDNDTAMMEILIGLKRAGADMIVTYFAKEALSLLVGR